MPAAKLKQFLDREGVKYASLAHSTAYTAQEIAALTHIPGQEMAKTVIVFLDGEMAMAVVPASHQVDLDRLRATSGAKEVRLAREDEFKGRFPDCETGAMPPFGNLYGMRVVADEQLAQDEEIAFNAGSHHELIRLPFTDFKRLAQPTLARISSQVPGLTAA